jgi:hypothetical protein
MARCSPWGETSLKPPAMTPTDALGGSLNTLQAAAASRGPGVMLASGAGTPRRHSGCSSALGAVGDAVVPAMGEQWPALQELERHPVGEPA